VSKEETLQTLLVEVEFLVNNRPLTNESSDPDSFTPHHILLEPRTVESTPPGRFLVDDEHILRSIGQTSFCVGRYVIIYPHYIYVESMDELQRERENWRLR
jgi:hypothetical protein